MIFIIDINIVFQVFSIFFETKADFIIYFNAILYKTLIINLLQHIFEKSHIEGSNCRFFFVDFQFHITIQLLNEFVKDFHHIIKLYIM